MNNVSQAKAADGLLGLQGKAAIVIGGGFGMGESTSHQFAQAGCKVGVVDLDLERAEKVAGAIREEGGQAIALAGDVTDDAALASIMDRAEDELGGIDALVTIVGQARFYRYLDMTPEDWAVDHDRNLRYFAFCAQAAARSMVKRGKPGTITAVASVSGLQSAPRHAAYGAAKAGLVNLVKSLAVELAEHGIRVNAIAPGAIATPRLASGANAEPYAERLRNTEVPFKRAGVPDDIAKAALFFASDLSTYVSGQTLAVDGGWMSAFLIGAPDVFGGEKKVSWAAADGLS